MPSSVPLHCAVTDTPRRVRFLPHDRHARVVRARVHEARDDLQPERACGHAAFDLRTRALLAEQYRIDRAHRGESPRLTLRRRERPVVVRRPLGGNLLLERLVVAVRGLAGGGEPLRVDPRREHPRQDQAGADAEAVHEAVRFAQVPGARVLAGSLRHEQSHEVREAGRGRVDVRVGIDDRNRIGH